MSQKQISITINGVTKTIRQWADEYGLTVGMLRGRIRRGLTGEILLVPKSAIYAGKLIDGADEDKDADEKAVHELWNGKWMYQGG